MSKSKNNKKDLLLIPIISMGIAVLGVVAFFVLQLILGFEFFNVSVQPIDLITPTTPDNASLISEDVSPLATPRFQDEDLVVMLVELNSSALIEKVSFYLPASLIESTLYVNSLESIYSPSPSDVRQIFIDIPVDSQSRNIELSFKSKSSEVVVATCTIQVTDTIEISGNCVW